MTNAPAGTPALPTQVITMVSPLDLEGQLEDANWLSYLVVRVEGDPLSKKTSLKLESAMRRILMVIGPPAQEPNAVPYSEDDLEALEENGEFDLDVAATAATVEFGLAQAGFTVLSAEVASGLTWLNTPKDY